MRLKNIFKSMKVHSWLLEAVTKQSCSLCLHFTSVTWLKSFFTSICFLSVTRNLVTVIGIEDQRNLIFPGRFLQEDNDFSAMFTCIQVSNQRFTTAHVQESSGGEGLDDGEIITQSDASSYLKQVLLKLSKNSLINRFQ